MLFPPLIANMGQELKCSNIPTILSDLLFIKYWLISKNVGIFLQSERSELNWTELNSSKYGNTLKDFGGSSIKQIVGIFLQFDNIS